MKKMAIFQTFSHILSQLWHFIEAKIEYDRCKCTFNIQNVIIGVKKMPKFNQFGIK